MSLISATGNGLYQFLQNISATGQTPVANATLTTPAAQPLSATATASAASTAALTPGKGHHRHHDGDLFKKIQDAVTTALQKAQSSGSSADPNKIIQNAIESVFKQQNAALQSGDQSDADGDTTDPAGADDAAPASSAQQTFLQTLKGYGVDSEQFSKDFLAAVQNAQNGQLDPSTAFQSFPTGSALDAIG